MCSSQLCSWQMVARCLFVFLFIFVQTNSLLENQNCFIELTLTELEKEQIKTVLFFGWGKTSIKQLV